MSTSEDLTSHGLNQVLLSRFLKTHFHNGKPTEVVDITVENAVPKGENYTSCVYRVKFRCLLANGRKKSFSMIVKTELMSETAKENLSAFPVFRTEIKMYTTVLTQMEDLQEEFGDNRECLWAHLYGYEPYKLVAFEDLTDKEYVGANRKNFLDMNHALLVVRGIARFHAMSKVLLARGLITEQEKGIIGVATREETGYRMYEVMLTVLADCMVKVWGKEWEPLAEKLAAQRNGIMAGRVADIGETYDKRFEVLNHGDTWTCNFLFKYLEFEEVPVSVRFLDFQICHINSFIWDIEYFVNTSVKPEVRREHKDRLLQAYQEALEKNCKLYDYSGYVPTLDDVRSESERLQLASLALQVISCVMAAETKNAFDMEKLMSHPPEEVIEPSVFSDGKALNALGENLKRSASIGLI